MFTYAPLPKAFEKQRKTIEDKVIKKVEALKTLKPDDSLKPSKPGENHEQESIEGPVPKNAKTNEIENDIDEIRKWEDKIKQKHS